MIVCDSLYEWLNKTTYPSYIEITKENTFIINIKETRS